MNYTAYQCNECGHVKLTSSGMVRHLSNAHGNNGELADNAKAVTVNEHHQLVGPSPGPLPAAPGTTGPSATERRVGVPDRRSWK